MSRTAWICVTVIVLGAVALMGTTMFQPSPAKAAGATVGGKFQVAASNTVFVLLDTDSGQSWILTPRESTVGKVSEAKQAWFPLKRLDTEMDIQKWRAGATGE